MTQENKALVGQPLERLEVVAFGALEGSILTLGGLVAPVLFRRISSRDRAGRIFGQLLKNWFWLGLACLITLNATAWRSLRRSRKDGTRAGRGVFLGGRLALTLNMLGLLAAFRGVLARMDTIRAGLNGPIDNYPLESGPRAEFNRLHKLSTKLMQSLMGLGMGWLVLSVLGRRK